MKEILETLLSSTIHLNKMGIFPEEITIKLGKRSYDRLLNASRLHGFELNLTDETDRFVMSYAGTKYTFQRIVQYKAQLGDNNCYQVEL